MEYYIFVIACTVAFYILYRYIYKKRKNVLWYTLLVPIILYIFQWFYNEDIIIEYPTPKHVSVSHHTGDITSVMSDTYPLTSEF